MAIKTTVEQLEEVQTAISQCLAAQSMGAGDKTIMRARLDFLQAREDVLLRRYHEERSGGGFLNKVAFHDPQ